jgi:hypothetical protein
MRTACLFFVGIFVVSPLAFSADAETSARSISCEICQMKDGNGDPCKGKVTKVSSSPSGINYICSNGHKFIVKSKIRVR